MTLNLIATFPPQARKIHYENWELFFHYVKLLLIPSQLSAKGDDLKEDKSQKCILQNKNLTEMVSLQTIFHC